MIRAGIVGLGWWGRTLVASVQNKSELLTFVAGYTRTPNKAVQYCQQNKLELRESLLDLIRDPRIDAVVLATPHRQHVEQIVQAAAHKKHVYVEKPLALDISGAQEALEAIQAAGVTLSVGFQRRFNPSHLRLKELIAAKRFGEILHCGIELSVPAALLMSNASWRVEPKEAPVGAMTPIGIHGLDALIDLLGGVKSVFCQNLRRAEGPVDDTTTVLMTLQSGASASLICLLATSRNYRFVIYGTKGFAEVVKRTSESLNFVPLELKSAASAPSGGEHIDFQSTDIQRLSLETFARSISSGIQFPIPAEQLLQGVAAFEAIVQSASSGMPTRVREIG